MTELMTFVGEAIGGGVAGNAVYDGLKNVFGRYFDKLARHWNNNEKGKFETSLEMLLEDEELKNKLTNLMNGKDMEDSIKYIKKSNLNIAKDTKMRDCVKNIEDSNIRIG